MDGEGGSGYLGDGAVQRGPQKIQTLSGDMEKKLLSQDLAKERDSDEDGGPRARLEVDSDVSLDEDEENDIVPDDAVEADPKKENWAEVLTKVRRKNNTGPKGVKADYEEAKAIMRRRIETKKLQDLEAFKRQGYGATTTEESISYHSRAQRGLVGSHVRKYDADAEDNSDEDGDSDDDDEAFLAAYRQHRMDQMSGLNALPKFGRVIPVDKFQFLDEIDNADPRTFVVTHIYEEYIAACRKMNQVLEQLAQKQSHVKICKLVATEADQTLSHRALPAFLVYRAGEIVNDSSVAINENEFGSGDFGLSDLEFFFSSRYGIEMQGVDVSASERAKSRVDMDADQNEDKWQSSSAQSLGRVDLLQNRVSKLSIRRANAADEDDDDW
ncbi:Phosducin-like protein [Hondaea fermentalgiana]|uniref:Phosducin-like protein n=1 Tax=Hondaea fermentalgiana TaxID=2315210 RepID=A0A2R5GSD5_9STRA|nr:Phosducin-like protein [Hondaea fermentalgiana]|eukprot:GBG33219.1 Phosducin-like protein [Hondaea fermentalgiana]